MIQKILIDAGMNGRNSCAGRRADAPPSHAYRIGKEVSSVLDTYGYEVLFSGDVPELSEHGGAGRPTLCASVAKKWRADAVLRLCVRAAELPEVGTVNAMAFRKNTCAWSFAESLVEAVDEGSLLDSQGVRASPRFLLLRKTPCPCAILVLALPFRQKEFLFDTEVKNYANCIASGVRSWSSC